MARYLTCCEEPLRGAYVPKKIQNNILTITNYFNSIQMDLDPASAVLDRFGHSENNTYKLAVALEESGTRKSLS